MVRSRSSRSDPNHFSPKMVTKQLKSLGLFRDEEMYFHASEKKVKAEATAQVTK